MAFEATGAGEALLVGRVLFATVLGYMAVGNLLDLAGTIGYAQSKGAPAARVMVPLTTVGVIGGAVAILVGAFPALGALAIIGFLAGVTPVMHDFWNAEGMERQSEQFQFLKNVGIAGGAFVFLAVSAAPWPYALGFSLW